MFNRIHCERVLKCYFKSIILQSFNKKIYKQSHRQIIIISSKHNFKDGKVFTATWFLLTPLLNYPALYGAQELEFYTIFSSI